MAKWGADTNPGTIEQPVLTIARACNWPMAPQPAMFMSPPAYTEPLNIREGVASMADSRPISKY